LIGVCVAIDYRGDRDARVMATVLAERSDPARRHRWSYARYERDVSVILLSHRLHSEADLVATSGDGSFIGVLDGEVFSLGTADTEARGCSTVSSGTLLRSFVDGAVRSVPNWNGEYVFACVDTRSGELRLATDRYGLRPHYLSQMGECWAVAPSLTAVRAMPWVGDAVDKVGMAEFLAFQHMLGDRTYLDQVKVVPPAAIISISRDASRTQRYWRYEYPNRDIGGATTSVEERAEELATVLRTAVDRRSQGNERLGVPLSGGLDSRAIAGFAHSLGRPISTFTFGTHDSEDVVFARRIAERLEVPWTLSLLRPDYLLESFDWAVRATDGLSACCNYHSLVMNESIEGSADVLLSGVTGDALTGGFHMPSIVGAPPSELMDPILDWINVGVPLSEFELVFGSAEGAELRGNVLDAMKDEMAQIGASHPGDVWHGFSLLGRDARAMRLGNRLQREIVEVRDVFADYDVVDLGLRLEHEFRSDQRAYIEMHRRHLTDIARIPRQGPGVPITSSLYFPVAGLRRKPWRVHQLETLVRRLIGVPKGPGFIHYGEVFNGPLRPLLDRHLPKGTETSFSGVSGNYVDAIRLEHDERQNRTYLIAILLTASGALRHLGIEDGKRT